MPFKAIKEENLLFKICIACSRTFAWRKMLKSLKGIKVVAITAQGNRLFKTTLANNKVESGIP